MMDRSVLLGDVWTLTARAMSTEHGLECSSKTRLRSMLEATRYLDYMARIEQLYTTYHPPARLAYQAGVFKEFGKTLTQKLQNYERADANRLLTYILWTTAFLEDLSRTELFTSAFLTKVLDCEQITDETVRAQILALCSKARPRPLTSREPRPFPQSKPRHSGTAKTHSTPYSKRPPSKEELRQKKRPWESLKKPSR